MLFLFNRNKGTKLQSVYNQALSLTLVFDLIYKNQLDLCLL